MNAEIRPESPVVLVLAAGRATRFFASGGQVNKLQASLLGMSVLEHVRRAVEASGLAWHIVRSAAGEGMGDSIAAGVRATAHANGWLVLPGDLPLITPHSLQRVAQALAEHGVVVPFYRGQQGHPVGFNADCLAQLAALTGEKGAASVVRSRREADQVLELDLDDLGSVSDVDTLEDLARIAQWLSARS